jgi:hypothetical protein
MIDDAVFKYRLRSNSESNSFNNDKYQSDNDDEDIRAVNDFR